MANVEKETRLAAFSRWQPRQISGKSNRLAK